MSDSDEGLPRTITRTRLWQTTLAVLDHDPEKVAKQELQVAFRHFREKARLLAAEIPRYLPEFTDHGIKHLDALWEMAGIVIGDSSFELNPAEAFVFGGAVLVHDCAMSLAAYPGRMDAIRGDPAWADTVIALYLERSGARPTLKQVDEPDEEIRNGALSTLLRLHHAEQAEALTRMAWKDRDGKTYSLIDERFQNLGEVIGKVAHSHHWSIERLSRDLPKLGTVAGLPPDWEIDPLKLACLLRIADACHLDERRAPGFLRAIRDLPEFSDRHWRFQNRLFRPKRDGDSLVYAATKAFQPEETASWWLCYETLTMVDRELREVDALLGEEHRHRLAVRRVAGAGRPERLAEYVQVTGWQPVDARLFIGEIPQLIERLGGKKLYGDLPWVPVRELLQNATDAVRAKRVLDGLSKDWGAVTIWVEEDTAAGAWYLHVEDNGIGMSTACVTNYLLNFGASYWRSDLVRKEHPGLIARGITQTGEFGIGFFSVFMVGSAVRLVTRQIGSAAVDTAVLELGHGLAGRPLLRCARPDERLRDSGTLVSVRLPKSPFTEGGFCSRYNTLADLVTRLCPASDVTINTKEDGTVTTAILADDWKWIHPWHLLMRFGAERSLFTGPEELDNLAKSMTFIYDERHNEIGRASLLVDPEWQKLSSSIDAPTGLITTPSGFKIQSLSKPGIFGILHGSVSTITRDKARIPAQCLARWATEQGKVFKSLIPAVPDVLYQVAWQVDSLGGEVYGLPIAYISDTWCDENDIENSLLRATRVTVVLSEDVSDEIVRISRDLYEEFGRPLQEVLADEDTIFTTFHGNSTFPAPRYSGVPAISKRYFNVRDIENGIENGEAYNLFDYLATDDVSDMDSARCHAGFIKYVLRAVCKSWKLRPNELREILPVRVNGTLECKEVTVFGARILISQNHYDLPALVLERPF